MIEGWEPYAWQLILTGERGPDGVPYSGSEVGKEAYEDPGIRAAMEDMGRKAFAHMHPGVEIASVRWYPLYDTGSEDDE